jgi:hypothetical protein
MIIGVLGRRAFAMALAPILTMVPTHPAAAFKNGLQDFQNNGKKTPGPAPQDIGLKTRGALRPCLDGKPHCFSSTATVGDALADTSKIGSDWLVQPWSYTGKSVAGALTDLKIVVDAYPPGQGGIDAGGFSAIRVQFPESADEAGYLYVQFESGARGYIDDMEFSVINGLCNVRTSSRLGYLDFGVNAKRYNCEALWLEPSIARRKKGNSHRQSAPRAIAGFASKLGSLNGWKTTPVRQQEHINYFAQNDVTDLDVGL